ncbi:unnamed protein product [Clonostachys byssicola]|uniref:CHAT domain-containing protein n=1 Tax=Clonostachys byssicola TaxID=160290 RepID=A0A9N9U3U4_9HYPO|nr:unnamed protein product [Clonostachys byssicola]
MSENIKPTQEGEDAADVAARTSPNQAAPLSDTALRSLGLLGDRFQTAEIVAMVADFEKKLPLHREAIARFPDNQARAYLLNAIANALNMLFTLTGVVSVQDLSVKYAKDAQHETSEKPENDPFRLEVMDTLRTVLMARYRRIWDLQDLEQAIEITRSVRDLPKYDYLKHSIRLADQLMFRYLRCGEVASLEEAKLISRGALLATSTKNPDYADCVFSLARSIFLSSERTSGLSELEEAIQYLRSVEEFLADGDNERLFEYLGDLSNCLNYKYSITCQASLLEEAIQLMRGAVELIGPESDRHPEILCQISVLLGERYCRVRSMDDLIESIGYGERAINASLPSDYRLPAFMTSLGNRIMELYLRTGKSIYLDKAIELSRGALKKSPEGHPSHVEHVLPLTFQLVERYSRFGMMADLEEAIQLAKETLSLGSLNNSIRATCFNIAATTLGDNGLRTDSLADLEESVRYAISKAASDLEAAMQNYELALAHTASPIMSRIRAGIEILELSSAHSSWRRAFEASATAVGLIPQLSMRSLENSDKQYMLRQAAGLTSNAVAAAINAGEGPLCALSLLEQGRGLIASSIEEIRTDVLELRKAYPELADAFVSLGNILDMPQASTYQHIITAPQAGADRRYKVDKELAELIETIRKKDGFGNFLRAPSEVDIQDAARNGPVVAINVSKFRCDALLVENHQIRLLPLPSLHLVDIKERELQSSLGSTVVLEWLWDTVTGPVLHALGLTPVPSGANNWPHIWWIPTGPLGRFPLHASGHHQHGCSETVCDRVMSSYSASIKMMIYGRRHAKTSRVINQALMLAMENTPGTTRLPFAAAEVKQAFPICQSMGLSPITPEPYKQSVLSQLSQCSVFHFAGHGVTHDTDPSKSHLLLCDGVHNPLTVLEILTLNLRKNPPFLAYLSACGTGRIRDEKFFDESIHLVSSFQIAGFRHVIGTLWEVQDEMCAEMATVVYEEMRDGEMSDDSVCRGLHKATRAARDRWLSVSSNPERSSRATLKRESTESTEAADDIAFLSVHGEIRLPRDIQECAEGEQFWVPYVHFGI